MAASAQVTNDVTDPYSRNLGRGKACDACRRRKLRCGGEKPSCNRCVEARNRKLEAMRRKGKSEDEIQAIRFPPCYIEGNEDSGNTAVGDDSTHHAKPDLVHTPFAAAGSSAASTGGSSTDPLTPDDPRPAKSRKLTPHSQPAVANHESDAKASGSSTTQNDLFFAEILSSHLPLDASSRAASNDPFSQGGTASAMDVARVLGSVANNKPDPLSGHSTVTQAYWSTDTEVAVPQQPLLGRLVDVFFEEHWSAFIFHPGRLRERLALNPQEFNYPHASSLHIIAALAYAARPDIDEEVSGEKPTVRSGAHYRHCLAAQHSVNYTVHADVCVNTVDLVRTCLLLVMKLYGSGDMLGSYLASAQAARLCISLNMNRDVPSRAEQQMQQLQFLLMQPRITDASIMKPEPQDEIEAEEVRRTMALMFVIDRTTVAATLWPGALTEEDYTAELPRSTLEEYLSTTTQNVESQPWTHRRSGLTLQSSDFFSRRAADAEQFLVKTGILLGRCAQYVTRLSRTSTIDQIVSATRFQQLESWITSAHLESYEMASLSAKSSSSSPPNATGIFGTRKAEGSLATYLLNTGRSDPLRKGYLITGSIVPYACTLMLHEPLAGLSAESEARCRAATRGAIGILRLYAVHAEEEMQRLDVLMTIVVMLVGRSLIRQFESLYSNFLAQEMAQQGSAGVVAANGDGSGSANGVSSATDSGSGTVNGGGISGSNSNGAGPGSGTRGGESVWNSEEFTESVSLLQADLEVALLTLKRFGEKWLVALKMHDSLLKLLQFNPEHRLRGLFCVE